MSGTFSRRTLWKELTRVRHMSTVSAVVLITTFAPLLGLPHRYEMNAFANAVENLSDTRADVFAPRRDDEAARERSAEAVISGSDARSSLDGEQARVTPLVVRADEPEAQPIEALEIDTLPPVEELETADPAPIPRADELLAPDASVDVTPPVDESAEDKTELDDELTEEPSVSQNAEN